MNERDPALDKAWREHSREAPPPALDAAILAAAHRAVDSKPRAATGAPSWWMPLMAAAAIGAVAIGVVQLAPQEPALEVATTQYDDKPAPAAEAPKPVVEPEALPKKQMEAADKVAPAERPSVTGKVASTPMPAARAPVSQERRQENKLAAARQPEPFPATPPKTEAAVEEPRREAFAGRGPQGETAGTAMPDAKREFREEVRKDVAAEPQVGAAPAAPSAPAAPASQAAPPPPRAPASAAALAPVPAPAPSMRAMEADRSRAQVGGLMQKSAPAEASPAEKARDPDAWIARIRKLRDEGRKDDALRELREFRANVADAEKRLPADLREWR